MSASAFVAILCFAAIALVEVHQARIADQTAARAIAQSHDALKLSRQWHDLYVDTLKDWADDTGRAQNDLDVCVSMLPPAARNSFAGQR